MDPLADPVAPLLPSNVEDLLAHREWISSLARSLVMDHARAEDLEQEAWLAAVEHAPQHARSPKGWLATVLRRAASKGRRSDSRRGARERAASRPEATPSTVDVVVQAETHARVVRAVLDLDEPYRTTVLLRFFEDLPPREVARRMGAPVETVRARSRRALEQLASRLEDGRGGRRAWLAALLPLAIAGAARADAAAASGSASSAWTGGLLVTTKSKVAALVACLALLALGVVLWKPWGRDAESGIDVASAPPAEAGPSPVPAPTPPGLAPGEARPRAVAEDAPRVAEGAPSPSPVEGARLRIRFTGGSPPRELSAREVEALYAGSGAAPLVTLIADSVLGAGKPTDIFRTLLGTGEGWQNAGALRFEDGGVTFEPRTPMASESRIAAGRWRLFVVRPGGLPWLTEPFDARDDHEESVTVPGIDGAMPVRVRLLASDTGAALAGAAVRCWFEYGDDQAFLAGAARVADSSGDVLLPIDAEMSRERGRPPIWWAVAEGYAGVVRRPQRFVPGGKPVPSPSEAHEVAIPRTVTVEGKAYLRSGAVAAGRSVLSTRKGYTVRTTVTTDGAYRLLGAPTSAADDDARVSVILVEDLEAGHIVGREEPAKPGSTVHLDIGDPVGSREIGRIKGRLTAGGRPLRDVFLVASTGGGEKNRAMRNSDADGRFEFESVPAGPARFSLLLGDPRVSDDFVVEPLLPVDVVAGDATTFDLDFPDGAIRVTVLDDATGKPVSGAGVSGRPANREAGADRFPGFRYQVGWSSFSDAEGQATLLALPLGEAHVVVAATRDGRAAKAEAVSPSGSAAPTEIVLRVKPKPPR